MVKKIHGWTFRLLSQCIRLVADPMSAARPAGRRRSAASGTTNEFSSKGWLSLISSGQRRPGRTDFDGALLTAFSCGS